MGDTHAIVLAIVADPSATYRYPTNDLERTLAVLRASYGGVREAPAYHTTMRTAEDAIAATIRWRRAEADAERATLARMLETGAHDAPQAPNGGSKVPVVPPSPTMPPAPAYAVSAGMGRGMAPHGRPIRGAPTADDL